MEIPGRLYKKIPEVYIDEFIAKQTALIKARMAFFCILAVVIYFSATFVSSVFYPRQFVVAEITLWGILLLSAIAIFISNLRARTMNGAKVNAYLFIALLLVIITSLAIVFNTAVHLSGALYMFLLLLVSFTIPWYYLEIIPITFMHLSAYSILFLMMQTGGPRQLSARPYWFIDGIIFIMLGFVLSIAVRRQETIREIENFLLLKEVEKASEQMKRELELAVRIHKTLVPTAVSSDKADLAVTYRPMHYMGGDYGGYHFIGPNRLLFIICDVTGHGVSAALTVNRLHTEFERLAREGREPGLLLNRLNEFLIKDFEGVNMYLTAFCGLIDFEKRELLYSNHGHPAQCLYRSATSDIEELASQTNPLGIAGKRGAVFQHALGINGLDRILLFTDGVVESKNRDSEEFGSRSVERFMRDNASLGVNLYNEKLMKELEVFTGNKFEDDIFFMTINIK